MGQKPAARGNTINNIPAGHGLPDRNRSCGEFPVLKFPPHKLFAPIGRHLAKTGAPQIGAGAKIRSPASPQIGLHAPNIA